MAILAMIAILAIISISAIMITIARYECLKKRLDFRNTAPNFKIVLNIFFKEKNEKNWQTTFYPLKSHDFELQFRWGKNYSIFFIFSP